MSSPHPACEQNPELPVEELLRRATVHPPYGEQVIDDLTPEEADAFLDAVLSWAVEPPHAWQRGCGA